MKNNEEWTNSSVLFISQLYNKFIVVQAFCDWFKTLIKNIPFLLIMVIQVKVHKVNPSRRQFASTEHLLLASTKR